MAARSIDNPLGSVIVSQQEYEYLGSQVEQAFQKLLACQEELTQVSQDGTDDENPAFAQVKEKYAIANRDYTLLRDRHAAAVIVTPDQTDNNCINEATTKVTLRCTYAPDDIQVREFKVGHEFGCITPSSPLFTFIKGKAVGFKGTFIHNTDRGGGMSYEVEVLDIQF